MKEQPRCGEFGHKNRRGEPCRNRVNIGQTGCPHHGGQGSGKTQEYNNEHSRRSHAWKRLKLTDAQRKAYEEAGGSDGFKILLMEKIIHEVPHVLAELAEKGDLQTIEKALDLLERTAKVERIVAHTQLIIARQHEIKPPDNTPSRQITEMTELAKDQAHGLPEEARDDYTD